MAAKTNVPVSHANRFHPIIQTIGGQVTDFICSRPGLSPISLYVEGLFSRDYSVGVLERSGKQNLSF